MTAIYYRHGKPFATYGLDGEGEQAGLLRLMAWTTAESGWKWVIE